MFEFSADDHGVTLEILETPSGKRIYRVTEWEAHRVFGGERRVHPIGKGVHDLDSLDAAYEEFTAIAAKVFILSKPASCSQGELLRLGERHAKLTRKALLELFAEQDGDEADLPRAVSLAPSSVRMWVPNLRLSHAAALAVPLGRPYHQAIRDKIVRLLEAAGEDDAKGIIGAYLEREEHLFLGLEFPEEWADQILYNDGVSMLVSSGDPENVGSADAELAKEASVEDAEDMSLGTFLSATPSDRGLD
jgi:hypothetical protein